jgi:hypothetical protein
MGSYQGTTLAFPEARRRMPSKLKEVAGFRACVRTGLLNHRPAPLGANENSPARPEALGAEGKCRVS